MFGSKGSGGAWSKRYANLLSDPVKRHDFLNLFFLPVIALVSSAAVVWPRLSICAIWCMVGYMFLDACWIITNPDCVPNFRLVLFHHFVSVLGLYEGIRSPVNTDLVANFGMIEYHTTYMTFRRLTGIRTPRSEQIFMCVTVLVRLGLIPYLFFVTFRDFLHQGIFFTRYGFPGLASVTGLMIFNVNFLIKRQHMFNYKHKDSKE
mmetsp:Transcript_10041/g.25509  ORF Transcript_10041/g.25509 Transcript_10041/m.25509 type:complete len:205 (-) Transcript_10041:49-663(-)